MKKLLSVILALVMILSLSTVAFADENGKQDQGPVVTKTYKVNNGTAPAETFNFKFEGVSYKNGDGNVDADVDIPAIGNVSIPFADLTTDTTNTVVASINADDYALGVYTYKVTEVVPTTKTTGVSYSEETLYLVLTILRDEDSGKHYVAAMHYEDALSENKTTGFTNEYDSGSLTVTKKITGNMADMNKKFAFTITITAPEGTEIKSNIVSNAAAEAGGNGVFSADKKTYTYTISLGHDESVTLSNIPATATYTVTEDEQNYTSDGGAFSDSTKTISANDNDTVTFTNTLTNEIDTGVALDSLPYVLLLAVACVGMAVVLTKKRRED